MITVYLTAAILCIGEVCYPALVGKTTPVGEFQLVQLLTDDPGYSGDVVQFAEDDHQIYAIHRIYLLNPSQHRERRLKSTNARDRIITDGCINVDPVVYKKIVECCVAQKLIIKR